MRMSHAFSALLTHLAVAVEFLLVFDVHGLLRRSSKRNLLISLLPASAA